MSRIAGYYKLYILAALVVALLIYFLLGTRYQSTTETQQQEQGGGSSVRSEPERGSNDTVKTPAQKAVRQEIASKPGENEIPKKRFQEAQDCQIYTLKKQFIENTNAICESHRNNPTEFTLCEGRLSKLQAELGDLPNTANCGTMDVVSIKREYYDSALALAKLGDVDAQMCILRSDFGLPENDTHQDYVDHAEEFAGNALSKGDWRVVALFAQKPTRLGMAGYRINGIFQFSDAQRYAFNRVERLGATSEFAQTLDQLADTHGLTPDDIERANTWANSIYNQHFRSSPKLAEKPTICRY